MVISYPCVFHYSCLGSCLNQRLNCALNNEKSSYSIRKLNMLELALQLFSYIHKYTGTSSITISK